ncbi:MAG: coproporphyrinogen III oxidase family protein [Rhodococcus sp.]|uniref:STM4012 family radical SAM protein n=1 Tax=Rhodococcus TaxID=1827 RepID=UPI0016B342F5|nr:MULTISPECIES: STM4012 family radical SAM protein [Rhodococcus]NLV79534.1 coproporphyrinogen III oxidase family protein [Rhodococcus sp. (in: high G+C Gram-positive bacteria)]
MTILPHPFPGTPTVDLDDSPYQGYLYAYPHKSSYRPLHPAPRLRDVWAGQDLSALFLYAHIPFCEMRCGFCNLFTTAHPPAARVGAYLDALARQTEQVRAELDATGTAARFAAAAIGGGTPTYLDAPELDRLFTILTGVAPELPSLPVGVETSPATATDDRLDVLAAHRVHRVSMGVQSFLDTEAHAAGRPQRRRDVDAALDRLHDGRFPIVNLDLIYGIDGQTARTWRYSLDTALARRPEEIYLYPLYVRPLTGLGHRAGGNTPDPCWDTHRLGLYRQGVEVLTAAGYRQLSMRQFRRADVPGDDTDYCCQDDGMIGLGCGARSYTTDLHYSFDYAVGVPAVRAILDDYTTTADFTRATVGIRLDADEQRRRWLIKTLLRADGVSRADYTTRFGSDPLTDRPELCALLDRGWATTGDGLLQLTADGLAHSDVIGPWLVSADVRAAMTGAALR